MIVTQADRARAERLLAAVHEPGATITELARILAEIREEAISCAVVRVERDFVVRPRQVSKRGAASARAPSPTRAQRPGHDAKRPSART